MTDLEYNLIMIEKIDEDIERLNNEREDLYEGACEMIYEAFGEYLEEMGRGILQYEMQTADEIFDAYLEYIESTFNNRAMAKIEVEMDRVEIIIQMQIEKVKEDLEHKIH